MASSLSYNISIKRHLLKIYRCLYSYEKQNRNTRSSVYHSKLLNKIKKYYQFQIYHFNTYNVFLA